MSNHQQNFHSFPPEVIVECRSGNLAAAYHLPIVSASFKKQLDMALWKQLVEEIGQQGPDTRLRIVFYGHANLITGYRLYYLISYAKRAGVTHLILQTDGTFWIEEATDWLLESGVDQIIVTIDKVGNDLAEMPLLKRISQLEAAIQAQGLARPSIEIAVNQRHWSKIHHFLAAETNIRVRTWPQAKAKSERVPCRYALETCTINWQGQMVACPFDLKSQYMAGQVAGASIANLWIGSHRQLQTAHYEGRFEQLPDPCATCNQWVGLEAF